MPEADLENLPVFHGLAPEQLDRLKSFLEERRFGPNEVVFERGDGCDGLYLVVQGGVVLRSEVPGRPVERLRDILAGELFGEMEVMQGESRLATARTVGETVVRRIPQERLEELLNEPFAESLFRSLLVRRREASRRSPCSRCEPRIWIDRDVLLTLDDGQCLRLRLENLSWSGACFAAVPDGWRVPRPVCFSLATGQSTVQTSGVVRWRHGRSAGIAFDGVGPAHRRRIARVLCELARD